MSVGAKLLDVQLQEEMTKPRPPSRPLSTTMAESIASLESSTMSQVLPSFIWQFNHEFWADGWYFIISYAFHLPQELPRGFKGPFQFCRARFQALLAQLLETRV